ncbi:MFS transporter [Salinibaculum rarum]|uniref:MFS transporter n=1 Tax=Salinibaculum rarum TaxID=3058903 RepID=UPI0026605497|nr:MFS transporter [Salinibaculum sp. KK48]
MQSERLDGVLPAASYRNRMLLALSLGWATLQAGRFLLPPLLPPITETFALSSGGAGLALTAFGLVYAVAQYPSGTYSDSLSRASLILPGFLVLLVGFSLVGVSTTVAVFVAGLLLLGIGKGLFASPARVLLGDLFVSSRGRALGIFSAGTDLGGLIAAGLAAAVLATTVWRVAFAPIIVLVALVTLLFVVWNRETYSVERVPLEPGETARRIVATQTQRERLLAYALFYFAVGGLTNFYPLLLVENSGFSAALASGAFALIFAVGILVKPTAGEVSDRFPRLLVSIVGLLVAAGGLALIILAPSLPFVALGTILTSVGYKTQFPIADAVVMEAAPADSVGGDLGAARGVFLAANAVGPGFVGIVADVATYALAFWALVGAFLFGAVILARQYRR